MSRLTTTAAARTAARANGKAAIVKAAARTMSKAAPDEDRTAAIEAAALRIIGEREAAAAAAREAANVQRMADEAAAREAAAIEAARPLAQRNGSAVFDYFRECAADTLFPAAAALLVACNGDAERAAALLGEGSALLAQLHKAAQVVTVLSKAAPREFFGDGYSNTDAVRIGDIHAGTLGLSKLYRATNKAALKAAREAARKLISKAE